MPLQPWCKLLLLCFNTKVRQNIARFSFVHQMYFKSWNSIFVGPSVCTHLKTETFFTLSSALGTSGSSSSSRSRETPPDSSGVQKCRSTLCSDRPQKYKHGKAAEEQTGFFFRVKFYFCKSENDSIFPRLVCHSYSKIYSLFPLSQVLYRDGSAEVSPSLHHCERIWSFFTSITLQAPYSDSLHESCLVWR